MVSERQVAVVTDSSACLPPQLVEKWQILVVPHEMIMGNSSLRDGIDITPGEFYHLLRNNCPPLTTSAPRPAAFVEAFQAAAQIAEDVLCITLSANFSATYDAARAACLEVRQTLPQVQVRLLDSQAAAGAAGLIVLAAARAAADNCDLDEVTRQAEDLIPQVQLLALLDTLHHLEGRGKVDKVRAWAASALGIKPIIELRSGQPRLVERPRSRSRGIDRLVAIMKARVGDSSLHVNLMEADAPEEAEALRHRVEQEFHPRELFVSEFTPVMGAHTGPGLLGLAFYTDM